MPASLLRPSPCAALALTLCASLFFACSSDDDKPLDAAAFATDEDTALVEDLASVLDVSGDVAYSIATAPALGTATVDATGSLTYTPDADANGSDSLVVRMMRGSSEFTSTIAITVNPINDAPVAVAGVLGVEAGSPVEGVLTATDVDGDVLSFTFTASPSLGTLTGVDAATGAFTYTADTSGFGPQTLSFTASDGIVDSQPGEMVINVSAQLQIPTGLGVEPAATLAGTGIFVGPPATLVPNAQLIPFELNQRLWTDWAAKTRYLFLPAGQTIDFDATGPYAFPVGTFFVKHFQVETSAGTLRNIETRVLVRKEEETVGVENWVGYTYQWNGEGADLVPDEATARIVDGELDPAGIAIDATALGGARQQQYEIPSRAQCKTCHGGNIGFVRGFRTLNLNRLVGASNQLTSLASLNIFTAAIPDPTTLGAYAEVTDTSATAEERTRSYLAVNCSHCHSPGGSCDLGFDLRYASWETPTGLTALLNGVRIVPNDLPGSSLYQRMATDASATPNVSGGGRFRMPLMQSNFVDDEALAVIAEFIAGL